MSNRRGLPPGQRRIDHFPRFGTHLHLPPPATPSNHHIAIVGADEESFDVSLAAFGEHPRSEQIADFHCVGGWTATGLLWQGVQFRTFFESVIGPRVPTGVEITHLTFGGLDGYRSVVCIEDAMQDDVMLADRLDGKPLSEAHGAPLRLVSPSQYGFISTKHLSTIELHTSEPALDFGAASNLARIGLRVLLFRRHPRSRVWEEERHRYLPGPFVRVIYRPVIPPILRLSKQSRRSHGRA